MALITAVAAAAPFILLELLAAAIVFFVPGIATWLPAALR